VLGLGAGARTGGRRPGSLPRPRARGARTRPVQHTAQRAIDDYSWMWQMKMRWWHGSQPYP